MTAVAIETHEQFPQKRLVIHYMQPHCPFVPAETDFDKAHLASIMDSEDTPTGKSVWSQKFSGELELPRDELWGIYVTNLEYVLEHVEDLLAKIPGKTVIRSDYGNYVGEKASPIPIREYGHPRGLYDEPAVRIPWLEHTHGDRREIVSESEGTHCSGVESAIIAERLRDLGYLE